MSELYRALTYPLGQTKALLIHIPYGDIEKFSWEPVIPHRVVSTRLVDLAKAVAAKVDFHASAITLGCSDPFDVVDGSITASSLARCRVLEGLERIAAIAEALKGAQRGVLLSNHLPVVIRPGLDDRSQVETAREIGMSTWPLSKAQEFITRPSTETARCITYQVVHHLGWWNLVEFHRDRPVRGAVFLMAWLIKANHTILQGLPALPADQVRDWMLAFWRVVAETLKPYWGDRRYLCNSAIGLEIIGEVGRHVICVTDMEKKVQLLRRINWARRGGDLAEVLVGSNGNLGQKGKTGRAREAAAHVLKELGRG